ncbi:MAG: hypothetical protein ACK59W_17955 [Pseudanabaena sp.]|jgi:hypothetical protein
MRLMDNSAMFPPFAIYDGKRWLVEKYRMSNLIAYSLSDFSPKQKNSPSILAGAFGGKEGEKKFGQIVLPATIKELMLRGMKIALTPSPLSQRGEGEQNPENSCPPLPKGEGLGVRVLETST